MSITEVEIRGKGGIIAKVVADSAHPNGGRRLTTLQLRYPRLIHSEFMTHRVFSRNASSSRAIPVAKMIEQVRNDPAMPIHWGANQPGMQAHGELSDQDKRVAEVYWRTTSSSAADIAEQMQSMGLHKQVANRILEPFQFISVIVTATEWDNFFKLRVHKDAQPEIRELATCMQSALAESKPKTLSFSDWHLPYVTHKEVKQHGVEVCRKLSAARCARVSYLTHDGQNPTISKDLELFNLLVGGEPLHASPIEHQARPDDVQELFGNPHPHLWGNFRDWIQFRKVYEESISKGQES